MSAHDLARICTTARMSWRVADSIDWQGQRRDELTTALLATFSGPRATVFARRAESEQHERWRMHKEFRQLAGELADLYVREAYQWALERRAEREAQISKSRSWRERLVDSTVKSVTNLDAGWDDSGASLPMPSPPPRPQWPDFLPTFNCGAWDRELGF